MQKFFVNSYNIAGGTVTVNGGDARHISLSLRMRRGENITVCDRDMNEYFCELTDFTDNTVTARILSCGKSAAEPPYRVRLYQALPKGDKFDMIVQKAVECGVYSVTPFESSRCIAKFGDNTDKKTERWKRISLEASKQCGRGYVPEILPPRGFDEMIASAAAAQIPLFCYEDGNSEKIGSFLTREGNDISLVIGSEGGFSPEEAEKAGQAGMLISGLGPRILRCETAAAFALACIAFVRELC